MNKSLFLLMFCVGFMHAFEGPKKTLQICMAILSHYLLAPCMAASAPQLSTPSSSSTTDSFLPLHHLPLPPIPHIRFPRPTFAPSRLHVLASSEPDQQNPKNAPSFDPSPKRMVVPESPPPRNTSPSPKVSTNFRDVFAFNGPAPERINGRLAMLGFVAALSVELTTANDLITQLNHGGIIWFLSTALLISIASLVPIFQGVSTESRSQPIMSAWAELLNGRLAMMGLVALAITEYGKMGPLV